MSLCGQVGLIRCPAVLLVRRSVGRALGHWLTARFRLADLLARCSLAHATLVVGWLGGHSVCYRLQSHTHSQIYFYCIATFPAPASVCGSDLAELECDLVCVYECWRLVVIWLTSTEVAVIYHKHHINISVIFIAHTTVTHVISTRYGMRYSYLPSYLVSFRRHMRSQNLNAKT